MGTVAFAAFRPFPFLRETIKVYRFHFGGRQSLT
jgi:hypothetical protein